MVSQKSLLTIEDSLGSISREILLNGRVPTQFYSDGLEEVMG